TKDGKDYKAVFQKSVRPDLMSVDTEPTTTFVTTEKIVINNYAEPRDNQVLHAEELVRHFHKIFHDVDGHHPQSKEISQALTLIAQYGLEKARFVIEFAKDAAAETNYAPQTIGGILQYTSRAAADYDRRHHGDKGNAPSKR